MKKCAFDGYLFLILCIYLAGEAFRCFVNFLNLRYIMRNKGAVVPPEFAGSVDEAVLKRIRDYEAEKTRFDFVSSFFGAAATVIFIFGGLLNLYNSWIASLNLSFLLSGWLFFILLFCVSDFLSIPFSLYRTFAIENAYGFNTMTPKLWVSDFTKSFVISTILLSVVILAGLWLVEWSPYRWWLLVWSFFLVFALFMMYISPYVIEPLFNKFTPVEEEALRDRIIALAQRAGITASRVLRVDASKRSRHTNAYFAGIGKTKRIVLYDTLLEGMNHDEILAVLAHEMGHWKKRHLLKSMALIEAVSLVALYFSFALVQSDLLPALFHISRDTFFAKVLLLAFLGGLVSMPLKPLMNSYSRRLEREADSTAHELTGDSDSMVRVLVKLSKENLSNLYPHPLYVMIYYSHPPILERIRSLREMGQGRERSRPNQTGL